MKIRAEKVIDVSDWDALVEETYGRTYSLQQQDGCKGRGLVHLSVPNESSDYWASIIPEIVNHEKMGVSFFAWLERDPLAPLVNQKYDYERFLWWNRNFYPDLQTVANDLYKKNLLEVGDYVIDIDW